MSAAIVCALGTGVASASPFSPYQFDNSRPTPIAGMPPVKILVDDYGGFGTLLGNGDEYQPASASAPQPVTHFAGAYLFISTPDDAGTVHSANIALTENPALITALGGSAIRGSTFTNLVQTLVTPNAEIDINVINSSFRYTDTATQTNLTITLNQQLITDPATRTTRLEQEWILENFSVRTGNLTEMTVKFHIQWDPDIVFDNDSTNDIVGKRAGCYVYVRDAKTDQAFSLEDDVRSSERFRFYFGGKKGVDPSATFPFPFNGTAADVFLNGGMPEGWLDTIANVGKDIDGESSTAPGTDANMGLEYQPLLFPNGGKRHVFVIRTYGTAIRTCPIGTQCGDQTLDPGEECQSNAVDSATCDFTCLFPRCGDGHVNLLAGETCESAGVDTDWCNGGRTGILGACKLSACGDGYANAAAGEACDDAGDSATCNADCSVAMCGDLYTNVANEECDTGGDTSDCDFDCTRVACGDGHFNQMAEPCDEGGVDTATCNEDCTVPMCGDGHANAAAGEECDGGELCDPAVCQFTFHLGGGCGGCRSGNPDPASILGFGVLALVVRRRRYNSRRSS